MAWWGSPAWAGKLAHPYLTSFGSFTSVQGVAVESETGNVYVYDGGASSVYKFDASGKPANFSSTGTNAITVGATFFPAEGEIAVDSSAGPAKGDVYVAHADGSIEIFSAAGEKLGELTEEAGDPWGKACGVAVDASGAVYVGLYYSHVNKYVPSSNPVTNADYVSSLEGLNSVCNVAADSVGNVYVDTLNSGPVIRYEAGQFGSPFASGSVVDEAGTTLAIDPANDEAYVDERGQIAQYGPHGEPFKAPVIVFGSSGNGAISESAGIAVSGFNHDIYVSDGKGAVSVFGALQVVAAPPDELEAYVSDVTATSVTLHAALNPEGSATAYHFEYGPTASYGASTPEADAGSSQTSVSLQMPLEGLSSATVYHYRLVATDGDGTVDGPDQTFTTQGVGGEPSLLDGRQWELVTPPDKHGANIMPIFEGVAQAAADGHAMTYVAINPTELEPEGNGMRVQVLSSRSPEAWSSKDIATPHNVPTGGTRTEYRYFSTDLSLAAVEPQGPFTPLSSNATERTGYIRNNAECEVSVATCYTPFLTAANVPEGTQFGSMVGGFEGATPDMRHLVLSSNVGLTSTPGDTGGLYEWSNGQLQIVSLLPEGEGGTPAEDPRLGYFYQGTNARNAISSDGSRVFWTQGGYTEEGLYVRDMVKHETLRIGSGKTRFEIANVDGSRVFFATQGEALDVCDIVEIAGKLACETTQLAPRVNDDVLGASDDGSYVYFVSNSALAPGAVTGTCIGVAEPSRVCNLYVEHRGGGGWEAPQLVGVISAADNNPSWGSKDTPLSGLTARVTRNGHWLAFMSQRNLTGYDTRDAVTGQPDEEVYLYDAGAKRLICASCDPTGGRPVGTRYGGGYLEGLLGGGNEVWTPETMLAANIPGWTSYELLSAFYQSRYLSDEGRLFFNSQDALVPQDVNGTWDVYEYEPPGVGNCTSRAETFSPSTGGCVDLVSSGGSPDQSTFMDASENGNDVFLMTSSHLASQDFDSSQDIYDAHVCSESVPCAAAAVSPPPCSTGDSCKAAPSPQPSAFGAPSSATLAGIGNVRPPSHAVKRPVKQSKQLARALKACHRKKPRRKRIVCERKVRKRYGANKATRGAK